MSAPKRAWLEGAGLVSTGVVFETSGIGVSFGLYFSLSTAFGDTF